MRGMRIIPDSAARTDAAEGWRAGAATPAEQCNATAGAPSPRPCLVPTPPPPGPAENSPNTGALNQPSCRPPATITSPRSHTPARAHRDGPQLCPSSLAGIKLAHRKRVPESVDAARAKSQSGGGCGAARVSDRRIGETRVIDDAAAVWSGEPYLRPPWSTASTYRSPRLQFPLDKACPFFYAPRSWTIFLDFCLRSSDDNVRFEWRDAFRCS